MSRILCIDTALETASVAVAFDGTVVAVRQNSTQADHSTWIHQAIKEVLNESGMGLKAVDAIGLTSGPGSYTGLRVGMATAKGLCYAVGAPLITENVLKLTAMATIEAATGLGSGLPLLYRPMIDARRMEVFTAAYSADLELSREPEAVVLVQSSFEDELQGHRVIFSGNGARKWATICLHSNAVFSETQHKIENLALVAAEKFTLRQFSDVAYSEPDYFKNFYTPK